MNNEIENLLETNKRNKEKAQWLVCITLVISFLSLCIGLYMCNIFEPTLDNEDNTEITTNRQKATTTCVIDTTCKKKPFEVKSVQKKYTEYSYSITIAVLSYGSIILFITLSLTGAFYILVKAHKSEYDANSKILDIQKDLYKEYQMWELVKMKNQQDFEDKEKKLQFKIKEFNDYEVPIKEYENKLKHKEQNQENKTEEGHSEDISQETNQLENNQIQNNDRQTNS